jgi:hypothetical protein
MAFMPQLAPLVVLMFLGTALILMAAGVVSVTAAVRKQPTLLRWTAIAGAVVAGGYATLLLGASLTSREVILGSGEKKYFCEIDCHLAYSVERTTIAKTLGAPPHAVIARGSYRVVALKTWFDETTTASFRPRDVPLYPNPRNVYVQDALGRRFDPSPAGQRALEAMGHPFVPLTRKLVPGESYVTELVFDLPTDAREPRLYVGDADPTVFFLIGHEESPLHKKIWFRI